MPTSGASDVTMNNITVGILEVQGAFLEHKVALQKATQLLGNTFDLHTVDVRTPDHVTNNMDGLIIPGGESTTISIYLKRNKMEEPLTKWINDENHVTWGTCAGMILLSKLTENQKLGGQSSLGVMDTDVSRNYFGRQTQSFEAPVNILDREFSDMTKLHTFPGVFIRAPAIVKTMSPDVNVLATVHAPNTGNDVIVAAKQGNVISTAFHPELTDDCSWHMYFLKHLLATKAKLT